MLVDQAQQVGRVGHTRDHLVAGVGEDALDARAQQRGVLGDHDAHGSTAVTIVGPVAGLETVNVPRAARTRSSSPRRPVASSLSVISCAAAAVVEHRDVQLVGRLRRAAR